MLYTAFEVGGESYKLRINARNTIELERLIGGNPLSLLMRMDKTGELPTVAEMVGILHIALQQYQHKVTKEAAFDIFDTWLSEEHCISEFMTVIIDIYKVSGFIPKDEETKGKESEDEEKN